MYDDLMKTAKKLDPDKKEIIDDLKAARMYFGHVLQSTMMTGYMEEYLYRGIAKLYELEDKVRDLK